jgi:hypothetical protein
VHKRQLFKYLVRIFDYIRKFMRPTSPAESISVRSGRRTGTKNSTARDISLVQKLIPEKHACNSPTALHNRVTTTFFRFFPLSPTLFSLSQAPNSSISSKHKIYPPKLSYYIFQYICSLISSSFVRFPLHVQSQM